MRLDAAQILVVAAEVLERPAEDVLSDCDVEALGRAGARQDAHLADGFSPPALAALLVGLVEEHPFTEGNDAVAVAAVGLAASLDGCVLDLDEIPAVLEQLHAGALGEEAVAEWLRERAYRSSKEGAMFERFTDRARRALAEAQEEAGLLGHDFIGTEHILLGVARVTTSVAAKALAELGVNLDALRADVKELVPGGAPGTAGRPPFTPRAKRLLEQALKTAVELGHNYIGTEHLLLACFKIPGGVAQQVLQRQRVPEERVKDEMLRLIRSELADSGELRDRVLGPINSVLDENDHMRAEIERLRTLLRRHGIDPDAGTASA